MYLREANSLNSLNSLTTDWEGSFVVHGLNRLRNAMYWYYDDSGRTLNSLRRMGGLTS